MSRRVRGLVIAGSLLFACTGLANASVAPIAHTSINNAYTLGDPGALPSAPDLATLERYRRSGTGSIVVHPVVENDYAKNPHGPGRTCSAYMGVMLYPEMPFTLYMLKRWASAVDGTTVNKANALPGLPGAGTANVPSLLDPRNKKGIVRYAACNDDGYAKFSGLPAGEYFAVTLMMWPDDFDSWKNKVTQDEPIYDWYTGDYEGTNENTWYERGSYVHFGDGYAVVDLHGDVSPGQQLTTVDSMTYAVAHFGLDFGHTERN